MRDILNRIKKLENHRDYRKSVIIFIYHGYFKDERVYLVQVQSLNFICKDKDIVNDLLEKVSFKYDIELIITDEWCDIPKLLEGAVYREW